MKGVRPLKAKYPDEAECMAILKAKKCNARVIVHCCTVAAVAKAMAERIECDRDLVIAGAMLHDIGRSVDHSIMHAVIGHRICEELGLPDEVCKIVMKHTGAGLDDIDVAELGLPPEDYIPATIEEKVVAHADNKVSNDRVVPHTHTSGRLREKGANRGADRIEALHAELSLAYGSDLDTITSVRLEGPCERRTLIRRRRF